MVKGDVHEFHLVLDRKTKEKLISLDLYKKCKGLSGMIVRILQTLGPVVKREHKWGKERMSRYMPVCNDPDEIREHVHVYFPRELYRELKLLHQDLNVYSIAQLLRGFIVWFIEFDEGCKGDVCKTLKKIFMKWEKDNEQLRLTTREYLRQLWTIVRHLPEKNRLVTIYDTNFSPFWILHM